MFESLVITLREGIEAALVVGILVTAVQRIGRLDLLKYVYYGLFAAVIGSALGAVALQMIVINEEAYEGTLYLLAAGFVSTMLIWMKKHARVLKSEIEVRIGEITQNEKGKFEGVGLFLFSFFMVFREGVETVLFLSAVGLTTEKLLSFLGGILGLGLAVMFGVAFVKGTVKIDLGKFFRVSAIVLSVFIVQLLINGLHEFSEAGILPASQREMAIVGPLVRNNAFFILAILLIPVLVFWLPSRKKEKITEFESGPERRLQLANSKKQARWRNLWSIVSLAVLMVLGAHAVYSSRGKMIDPPLLVQPVNGEIRIPLREVQDGHLHRYGLEAEHTLIRFLVIKNGKDKFSAAFDLCQICGDYGYVQEGENIICLNCIAAIFAPSIGIPGGCNPIPLVSQVSDEYIVIHEKDLLALDGHFTQKMMPEVKCEVCGMKLHPEEIKERMTWKGKTIYFCPMKSCQEEFKKHALQNPE